MRTLPGQRDRKSTLGLKIDVDTYLGMKKGVPRLLSTLGRFGIRGTFFLSMGPDASGRAIFKLIKNPRFLKKMLRTNAAGLYGVRTALYGTLLPSPMIALSSPQLVERMISEGHEVEFHAWDHRRWQDDLLVRSTDWIEDWFQKGVGAYRELLQREPSSFGAPAWLIDTRSLQIAAKYSFTYLSCTRAKEPFVHETSGLMEVPSDLPCLEEIGIKNGVSMILHILEDGGTHVLPVHAEVEGGIWNRYLIDLLEEVRSMDYEVVPLSRIRDLFQQKTLPVRRYRMELLPGRSVPCAV